MVTRNTTMKKTMLEEATLLWRHARPVDAYAYYTACYHSNVLDAGDLRLFSEAAGLRRQKVGIWIG